MSVKKHPVRTTGLAVLGKTLIRRCRAHCELCHAHGVKLVVYEVPPLPGTPDPDRCVMICSHCLQQLLPPRKLQAEHWHCLARSMWSETAAVKVVSVLLLQKLGETEPWAIQLLEQIWLAPDEADWLATATLFP